MAVAVVDSNVLIDYKDTSHGSRNERAVDIVHANDRGDPPTARVTNYVLLESLNRIHERQRHDIAVDLRDRLSDSAGFEEVHSAQKDFHRAVELFEAYGGLAFGDATIAAYMEREDIEYLYSSTTTSTRSIPSRD
ncbi:putative nucleic acid-binding protein [Halorubrum trapanicum]|uniref:Putative nucleic acid-binding protein n=1 Tax=Halorubrum trapanicum TaxID=29284 RepID=A0A8J7RXI0_9EURY|nr:PIN domain-containing protein [Halorubrum trapanicum]MBP1902845.1 putative nucleic acid-binding protein [Halorubrum trapanicum]